MANDCSPSFIFQLNGKTIAEKLSVLGLKIASKEEEQKFDIDAQSLVWLQDRGLLLHQASREVRSKLAMKILLAAVPKSNPAVKKVLNNPGCKRIILSQPIPREINFYDNS
jgi:hypothetical protein